MKTKSLLTVILTLIGLVVATGVGYALARLMPEPGPVSAPNLPLLSRLGLPSQTQNGITATLESYYADATRLVFAIRVGGRLGNYSLDHLSLKDSKGEELNAGYSIGPSDADPLLFLADMVPAHAMDEKRWNGQLSFAVSMPGEEMPLANFHFDLNFPVHPALTFNPKQTIRANGIEILLDRLVITPSYTQAYLCYLKPTDADWGIGHDALLQIGGKTSGIYEYGLLYDSSFGDLGKGGDPAWTPPINNGRCVKIGFPIGDANPNSFILTIPALEQSLPEVIPDSELVKAYEILNAEGINMQWHTIEHGAYPEYKKLPFGMTEEDAYQQFIQALGYIYPGIWMFNIPLKTSESAQPVFSTSSYGDATSIPFTRARRIFRGKFILLT
jgi:hypothetical protein